MGQRLNMEIYHKGECIANAYYHWSAYTCSALTTIKDALYKYEERKKEATNKDGDIDYTLLAIRMLEDTGSGFNKESIKFAKEMYPDLIFNMSKNRNEGITSIDEKNMDETRNYEEGRVNN